MAAAHEMRVSDAEREAAAAELREHFASGRLNTEDLDERLTAVFAAKTRGDLSTLFTDLPSAGHGRTGAQAAGRDNWALASTADPYSGGRAYNRGGHAHGGGQASAGRMFGRVVFNSVLVWVLFIFGILGVFGLGVGRPFGVALLVAAFALLRRLVFIFIGRRRGGRGGPRRGGSSRRGGGPRRHHR